MTYHPIEYFSEPFEAWFNPRCPESDFEQFPIIRIGLKELAYEAWIASQRNVQTNIKNRIENLKIVNNDPCWSYEDGCKDVLNNDLDVVIFPKGCPSYDKNL